MITPLIVAASPPTPGFESAWRALNDTAAIRYTLAVGAAPRINPRHVPHIPASYIDPTTKLPHIQTAAVWAAEPYKPASIVFADVHSADGFGIAGRCAVIGGNNVHALLLGNPPNISLWILMHEWGHMFGLEHPFGTYAGEPDRTDTIMGYGSAGPFERDPASVSFTPDEIAHLRRHPEFQHPDTLDTPDTPATAVQTRPLGQGDTIAFFNTMATELGELIADAADEGVFEITTGFPVPQGKRAFIILIDEDATTGF